MLSIMLKKKILIKSLYISCILGKIDKNKYCITQNIAFYHNIISLRSNLKKWDSTIGQINYYILSKKIPIFTIGIESLCNLFGFDCQKQFVDIFFYASNFFWYKTKSTEKGAV